MKYSAVNINYVWSHLIVEELVRNGVSQFCISPGSRSAPLAVAAANHPDTQVTICLDERGAGFFALGYARATGIPAVLICTSGTAAANYYPAVIEARQSALPLILLTADRPPELRESGANQAIDQVKMFGSDVTWFFELPCPNDSIPPSFVLTTVDKALQAAWDGPVHINCMFREPLAPQKKAYMHGYLKPLNRWEKSSHPYTHYLKNEKKPVENNRAILNDILKQTNRGLIIAGPQQNADDVSRILELADHLKWPVFADVHSGITRRLEQQHVINFFDVLLLNNRFMETCAADTIIQFGRPLTSKRLTRFIRERHPKFYIVVDDSGTRLDPEHLVTHRYICHAALFCRAALHEAKSGSDPERITIMKRFDQAAFDIIASTSEASLTEPVLAFIISQIIPPDTGLFLGSSMPIRDMDMAASFTAERVHIGANRGASGIDGTIASTAGYARGLGRSVTSVVGDIATLHDLNSMDLIRKSEVPIHLIIINNNGGGIFSFLPIAEFDDVFEYFRTAHDITFDSAAKQFGLMYSRCTNTQNFREHYQKFSAGQQSSIIEVTIDAVHNYKSHHQFEKSIKAISI